MSFPIFERLYAKNRPLVIAHRGSSSEAPENTVPAFEAGVSAGSDLVELDYRHSSDEVPVVIHDETLDRTTDAQAIFGGEKIPISTKSMVELGKLDAGIWFSTNFAGTRLPTLSDSLDSILEDSIPLIERKAGDAKTLVEMLSEAQLIDRVVVQAFDWEFLLACRELTTDLALVQLGDREPTEDLLATYRKLDSGLVAWKGELLTPQVMDWFHSRHIDVWAWTIDEPSVAGQLLALGVRGIITNRPTAIRRELIGDRQG